MDKDTKLIFAILAIIAVLVGVFIWKVATTKEETIDISENTYKDTEQTLTDNDDLIEEDWFEKFNDALIISFLEKTLEKNEQSIKVFGPLFIGGLAITIIVIAIKTKSIKFSDLIRKRGIILLVIFTSIFGFYTIKTTFTSNAIEYAIENKSWYTEKDTVKRVTEDDGVTSIYLKEHGKQQIRSYFTRYSEGDEVEILMVEGKFGGKYEIGIR